MSRLSQEEEPLPPEICGRPAIRLPLEDAVYQVIEEPRAEQPPGNPREAFVRRKKKIHQNIRSTIENMNELEDSFYHALSEGTHLRVCWTELAHAQLEILRLRALPQPQVQAAPANEALADPLRTQLD